MKSVSVHNLKGKVVGKVTLDQAYFDGKVNQSLLHQSILMYLANLRMGCAFTKTRSEVRGGGRKPWRQKGTGRARVGSIRNPIWRGGGVAFGPRPRDFRYNLPQNIRRLALRQSLNGKIKDKQLVVLDKLSLDSGTTKTFAAFLKAIKLDDKALVVIERNDIQAVRACRNIPGVTVKLFSNINAFDVLKHNTVILSKQALDNLVKLRKK